MSLRDQLIAKGFANKKRARDVGRELKKERKRRKGNKKKLRELKRQALTAQEAARADRITQRKQRQARYEEQKAQMEAALRVRNLVIGNQLRIRPGKVVFHHLTADGRRLRRVRLPEQVAAQLRAGELAIVASPLGVDEYAIVPRAAAETLGELAPHVVVFLVTDRSGVSSDPALGLHTPDWEPDLRARRQRP